MLQNRVVLIDRETLTGVMINNRVGVSLEEA
jgi:restriction endonuclease Mrr